MGRWLVRGLVSGVVCLSLLRCGPETTENPGPAAPSNGVSALELAERMYSVVPVTDESSRLTLALVSRSPAPVLALCSPEEPRVVAGRGLTAVEMCLAEEENVDLEALLQESLKAASEAVLGEGAAAEGGEAKDALADRARAVFEAELRRRGWHEWVRKGWKKHVEGNSECYQRILRRYGEELHRLAERMQIRCDAWDQYLGFCTADSDRVADHVTFHSGFDPPEKTRIAIEKLMGKAGLSTCMARIIEHDDPALAEQVRGLRARLADPPDMNALNARAWALWRRRGVEQWLEQVAETGELPEDLRVKIALCGGGRLPPVVGQRPGGETPAPPGAP